MGKLFVLLILGLGAALYFPQTRPVVLDTLAPVLNPVLVWQTKGEMDHIVRELLSLNRQGQTLPASGDSFQDWMRRSFQGGSLEDAWGVPYTLRVWTDSVGVVSNGPDLEIGTTDDVMQTALIQRRRQPRNR